MAAEIRSRRLKTNKLIGKAEEFMNDHLIILRMKTCLNGISRPSRILLLTLSGALFATLGPLRTTVAEEKRPNILFFLVDDYDKPETSVYGGKVLTPNLDRMAREGMTFHNAHVTSTVCTPSRYSFLTGRYAGASNWPEYLDLFPAGRQGLPAFNVGLENDRMNVARVLSENGYVTGFVGKYHLGAEHGFEDVPKGAEYSEAINRKFYENEKRYRKIIQKMGFSWVKNVYPGNLKSPFKGHNPEWTIKAALEFIENHQDGPFYLHYCTTLMHGPNGEWHRSLTTKALTTGEGRLEEPLKLMDRESVMKRISKAGLTESEAGYLWMDDSLGLLLKKLDELGIAENTIVVFVSDHGSEKKGSLFKSRGTEIPCLIRWPAVIKPGSVTNELVQNTDFVPTWFEVARARPPEGYRMDGVSMLPLLKNPEQAIREFVYGEQGPARSIKTKRWNYIAIRYTTDQIDSLKAKERFAKSLLGLSGGISRAASKHPGAYDADQLYDLKSDPAEQKNVAALPEFGPQLKTMRSLLSKALKRIPDRPYGEFIPGRNTTTQAVSQEVLEQLKKLAPAYTKKARKQNQKKRKK